ncbi:MAG: SDR family oxidoreductase [Candidatus Cloacimonadota bacterium]|nr:SDR family oxidoreductase [Candidatus Cloacimonadota bacterium]
MENRTLIITGANGNVGSYLASKFIERERNLILIVHKNRERIEKLLTENPGKVKVLTADISKLDSVKDKFNEVVKQTGWRPTELIHTSTARSHDFHPLVKTDEKLWQRILLINVMGTYNILKTILPYFKKSKYGKIVLFGSNVSRIGLPRGTAYSASKAAISNLCRSVAVEEAANKIIINTISPGPIKIDDSHFSESYRKFREEYYQEKLKEIPLKRCASFEDIFGLCRFLISKDNSYITGEEFFVTGGKL